jgi:hypothetical protein
MVGFSISKRADERLLQMRDLTLRADNNLKNNLWELSRKAIKSKPRLILRS